MRGAVEQGRGAVLAVDLGGTNLRAAAVAADGSIVHRQSVLTKAAEGPDAVIGRIARLVDRVANEAGLSPEATVGIAAPGPLNPRTGVVHSAPNLPGWHDVPLRDLLSQQIHRTVVIGNDANCAALGEARFGAGAGVDDMIYLGLGTGVGGGVISGGQLIDGAAGMGGELGHMTVAMDGPRCTCGGIGCLESFTSGWAIAYEGTLVADSGDGAELRRLAGGAPMTAEVVAAAAQAGDPAARRILERAGRALGAAMGALINIFNPDLFVIGGGMAELELLRETALLTVPRYAFRLQRERIALKPAQLGDDAGLLGAGALAQTSTAEATAEAG